MKKIIIAFSGFLYGIFSAFWGLYAIGFTFPISSPGSMDYEYEDKFFIPFGIIMMLSWLAATAFIYYKMRKSKSHIVIFSAAYAIATVIFILWGLGQI